MNTRRKSSNRSKHSTEKSLSKEQQIKSNEEHTLTGLLDQANMRINELLEENKRLKLIIEQLNESQTAENNIMLRDHLFSGNDRIIALPAQKSSQNTRTDSFLSVAPDDISETLSSSSNAHNTRRRSSINSDLEKRRDRNRVAAYRYRQKQNERQAALEKSLNEASITREILTKDLMDLEAQIKEMKEILTQTKSNCPIIAHAIIN